MKLTILGSGVMWPTVERNPSGFLLEIGRKKILLDCGFGVIRRLIDLGYNLDDINHIFLSHFHVDHFGDAFPLVQAKYIGEHYRLLKHKKITYYAPKGAQDRWDKWRQIYWSEPNENPNILFVEGPREIKIGETRLDIFPTQHVPWFASQGVVIRHQRKKIVYTGDLGSDHDLNNLIEITRNADLFITEAAALKKSPNHLTFKQAYTIAKVARVKKFIITHVHPQKLEYVSQQCQKENNFIMGIDGMEVKI